MPDKTHDNGPHDHGAGQDLLRHTQPRSLKLAGFAALAVALGVAGFGIASRVITGNRVENWTEAQAVQNVQVLTLASAKKGSTLSLPGEVQAFINAPIYGQVSGYVKKWYVDIGAPVKQGQLLAELSTPELDGQLQQAQANLLTAQATQRLSAATAQRWDSLFRQGAVSRQDFDEKQADLAAKTAAVEAARAAVYGLQGQSAFKQLVAPFDGTVTSRSVDIGNLVTVGNGSGTPLFTVADRSKVRIYVRVPQTYAGILHEGMTAEFSVPEYPGKVFTARLAANADAVSGQSGTLLVQFLYDNPDGAIRPGAYAEVKISLPAGGGGIRVPATALIFRDEGLMVATVGPDNKVVLKTIRLRQDMGAAVMVASGLSLEDRVIDNPPDSIQAGDTVRVTSRSDG
jgi:RND family efflux transporter MFP subunit